MSSRVNFFFTEAIRSLSTNIATSVAATLSMLVALLLVGVFGMSLFVLRGEADTAQKEAGLVKVFLQETATEEDVNALRQRLDNMPEVESVTYVSKEDAYKEAEKIFKDSPEMMENLTGNPFPASLRAKLKDPRDVDEVAARMKGDTGVDEVKYGGQEARKVIHGARYLSIGMLVLAVFLVAAATMLVANTIRLSIFARRREIEVMKLVGASNSFVRLPFMIEGFLCGLFAAVAAIGIMFVVMALLGDALGKYNFTSQEAPTGPVFLGVLAMGVVLGTFGSGITIRKYLRV